MLKKADLDILGKILTNNYLACSSAYKDVNEMALIISDKNMVVKIIDKDLAIIIASKTFPLPENITILLDNLVEK